MNDTKMKHTPGPWFAIADGKINSGIDVRRKEGVKSDYLTINYAGNFPEGQRVGEEDEANARLIAAAPELLNALKYLLGGRTEGAVALAEAAIAKAEGRE